jgi:hypothetical protein
MATARLPPVTILMPGTSLSMIFRLDDLESPNL